MISDETKKRLAVAAANCHEALAEFFKEAAAAVNEMFETIKSVVQELIEKLRGVELKEKPPKLRPCYGGCKIKSLTLDKRIGHVPYKARLLIK